jgi:hypothetical protein
VAFGRFGGVDMDELLTPAEASPIAGVPAVQLMRWAWLRVGPRNSGTKFKPRYHADDLREWREAQHAIERRIA